MLNLFKRNRKEPERFVSRIMDYDLSNPFGADLGGRPELPEKQVAEVVDDRPHNVIIEEIHETFYTEVDRLLADAKILNSLESSNHKIVDKANRLSALGFTSSLEVKDAEEEIGFLNYMKAENDRKENLRQAIEYFSFKYPHYKFITEDSVKGICRKYGLIYGPVQNYIGTIPDKNLEQIEKFTIDVKDEAHELKTQYSWWTAVGGGKHDESKIINSDEIEDAQAELKKWLAQTSERIMYDGSVEKCPLEIAAPKSNFNTDNMEVKDFQLTTKMSVPDPVVLKPVYFNKTKHYLIVTAWGLEASDEDVVNPKNN